MTMGGSGAFTTPISGIVTWKSERISSRNASNGSSARSISSIKRTGGPARSGSSARNSGRLIRNRSEKIDSSILSRPAPPASARRISTICRA